MSFSVPSLPRGIAESILFFTSSLHEDPGGSKIAPGAILEPPGSSWSEEVRNKILSAIPLGRLGTEKDIAGTVKFLVDSEYITGQAINVDGGRSLS